MDNNKNNQDPLLLNHNYDGIQELDNPLPNWWLMTFLGAIIFGFLYFIHFHLTPRPSQYEEAMNEVASLTQKQNDSISAFDEKTFKDKMDNPETLLIGAQIFKDKCLACHGDKGQGLIGPNLTDKFWLHGGQPKDIYTVIDKGVLDKGMPNWDTQLKPEEILATTVFVHSLIGSDPPNAKAPQGEEVSM